MGLNFDTTNVDKLWMNATTSADEKQKKYVLHLSHGRLSCIPLSETKCIDRALARIGFGSLNLKKIALEIQKHGDKVSAALGNNKEHFYKQLYVKCHQYNDNGSMLRSLISTISSPIVVAISLKFNMCSSATAQKDTTYGGKDEANCDISYADQERSMAFVLDGAGHNNSEMKKVLKTHADEFIKNYNQLDIKICKSMKDAEFLIAAELKKFAKSLASDTTAVTSKYGDDASALSSNPGLLPAFSFTQAVHIDGKQLLLSMQSADTAILIKKADGSFIDSLSNRKGDLNGFGSPECNYKITATALDKGDTIVIYSDGVGEFLTMDQFKEIITTVNDPEKYLEECKKKILDISAESNRKFVNEKLTEDIFSVLKDTRSSEFSSYNGTTLDEAKKFILNNGDLINFCKDAIYKKTGEKAPHGPENGIRGANGLPLKYHSSDTRDTGAHDDISIATLVA